MIYFLVNTLLWDVKAQLVLYLIQFSDELKRYFQCVGNTEDLIRNLFMFTTTRINEDLSIK